MKETDYRRAHNLGDGSAGGVGLGDEFVLTDVKVTPALGTAAKASSSNAPAVTASASATTCPDQGVAYRVTGTAEEKIKQLVGHQLEIQGRFKHAADAAVGGTRPGEKLPAEVEIVSFREAPVPAVVSEPAAPLPTTPPPPPPTVASSTATTSTVATPRTPAPAPVSEPRNLPNTASSTTLLGLIGVLALSSGVALTVLRRRAL